MSSRRVRLAWVGEEKILRFFRATFAAGERTMVSGLGLPPGTEVIEVRLQADALWVKLANPLFGEVRGGRAAPPVELDFGKER